MADARARHLRRNQTIAETRLWKELRELRHQGYHFRRQVPIEPYIVDFACFSQRVVIEVDGYHHGSPDVRRMDARRDADLEWRGFRILRFSNAQVAEELEGVMLEILHVIGVVEKQE